MSDGSNGVAGDQIRQIIERVEKLDEERRETVKLIAEVYLEAKGNGLNPKIIKKIVAARKKAADARREENELLTLYADAIGQGDLFA